jgi:TRAP-type uncharacterized transport system substrate-binding protein
MDKPTEQESSSGNSLLPLELLKAVAPVLLLTLLVLVVGYKFIDPAPPKKIVISVSQSEGNYQAFAYLYAELLKREGVTLEIHQSQSEAESLKLLHEPKSGVDLALIQGGVASSEPTVGLVSLGSLYYQPAWVFCRCAKPVRHLTELKGKRIAIGTYGTGARVVADAVMAASGLDDTNSTLLVLGDDEAAQELQQGRVDAAFFLDVPHSPLIQSLAMDKHLRLLDFTEAEAYTHQLSFLHHLKVPDGGLSLAANLPDNDVNLLAPTVMLVARDSFHPALVYLVLKTISQVHGGGGLFNAPHEFPSAQGTDFALSEQAAYFYKSGLPFLDKYLPFWAATFVNRMLILLLPLLAVIYPLSKVVPSIYVWLVKSKIYKLYGELRYLETQIRLNSKPDAPSRHLADLKAIEDRVNQLKLPNAFAMHLYELRAHIAMVRGQIQLRESKLL